MAVRITNDMRTAIAEAAVKFSFDSKLEALTATEDALAREAYASVFTVKEIEMAGKLPEGWLRKDECLRFNVGGQNITLKMIGEGVSVPYKPKNASYGGYGCNVLGVIPHGDLCDRIQKHAQASEAYRDERKTAMRATVGMLNQVNTTKRLKEVWPEGEQFFSRFEGEGNRQLPAVRLDEINQMLGLAA